MNSNRLKYFIVVTETESIRKSAEILHISPAALSKAIKQLEVDLGITLLVPFGRGIYITEEGRELARQVQPLITELDAIKKTFKEKNKLGIQSANPLRIGSFEIFTSYFLSSLLNCLPAMRKLIIRNLTPGQIEKSLLENGIDLGITYLPIPTSGISHHLITQTHMHVYGIKGNFDFLPFSQVPFVVPGSSIAGSPNKVTGLDGWPETEVERLIRYQVDTLASALELCRRGKAVAYLPAFVAELHNETVKPPYCLKPLPSLQAASVPLQQGVYIAKRKADPKDTIFMKIAETIRAVCSN